VPLLGDARQTLEALLPLLEARRHDAWIGEFRACDAIEEEKVCCHDLRPTTPGLRMGEVVALLAERTGGEAIVVSDVGQHQMAASRYSRFERPRTSITSGGLGTMGFALPAAMGAKLGDPSRTVIAIIGDGGFQMNVQELGTIMQTGCAVKIVILNNSFLGMVRQWQQLFFERRYSQTDMANPDFLMLAAAYGIPGLRVDTREALPGAVDAMLAYPGPFLLDARVEREENVFPMVPSGASISDIKLEP
jgi:acetolactate synthase-1/2/3 large subunit